MPPATRHLCHQAIFMNHAPCAVTPLDPELILWGSITGSGLDGLAGWDHR
jgi:hypothetical protein